MDNKQHFEAGDQLDLKMLRTGLGHTQKGEVPVVTKVFSGGPQYVRNEPGMLPTIAPNSWLARTVYPGTVRWKKPSENYLGPRLPLTYLRSEYGLAYPPPGAPLW